MYDATPDPYCYPGTTVLKNRLGLSDQAALDAFEADVVTQRGTEPLPAGRFSPSHFRAVHRHLFQDVYSWAGRHRTVRIAKDGSMFCYPEHIDAQLRSLFGWLRDHDHLAGLDAASFARQGAHFLGELNAIHAFREGNGRTQMAFFAMLADRSGHPFDLGRLDPEKFLAAMILSFNGDETELTRQIENLT
ncbi:Fic family protein [Mesorhizobium sp. LHD-90]|uniref:Fic/DOC family protein n=1 Tax=Mesorhizobium sp. LHD-90 TaxID=3071414 RepID=UPI0027E02E60|nr:Fic family protein [Mesorhizobium sp. LHD-90]MDQ6436149.1 Fic family protein [Mesorhizobium sp. LHD-90]